MSSETTKGTERAVIVLQGGGQLEDVAQILDIRLEPDPLRCTVEGPNKIRVQGGVKAFVYCRTQRGRDVEGKGVYIPISTRVGVGSVPAEHTEAEIERLESDYDYNPITGELQHRITVHLLLKDRRGEGASQEIDRRSDTSRGETRLSQIRTGASTDEGQSDEDLVSTREPTPEEFAKLRGALTKDRRSVPAAQEVESLDAEPLQNDSEVKKETPRQKGAQKKGPIVWDPFPPPIA